MNPSTSSLAFIIFLLGDDKIGHHVVVDFPKEYKILFQIPNNQEFNENDVYQNSEYGNSRAYDDYVYF
jgi:hypothetical protein